MYIHLSFKEKGFFAWLNSQQYQIINCISQIRRQKDKGCTYLSNSHAVISYTGMQYCLALGWQEEKPPFNWKSLSLDQNIAIWVHSPSTSVFSIADVLWQAFTCRVTFQLALIQHGGGVVWGIHQSQLYLSNCIDVIVIVFGSLSSVDNIVTFSVLWASGRQPRPSILSCLPLISISPTSYHIKANRRSHLSLYLCLPNYGGQRGRQALWALAYKFPNNGTFP